MQVLVFAKEGEGPLILLGVSFSNLCSMLRDFVFMICVSTICNLYFVSVAISVTESTKTKLCQYQLTETVPAYISLFIYLFIYSFIHFDLTSGPC